MKFNKYFSTYYRRTDYNTDADTIYTEYIYYMNDVFNTTMN